jgi:hypothetical protein
MKTFGLTLLLAVCAVATMTMAEREDEIVAGLSQQEALTVGARMYRQGILPSGEPMRAWVENDIEVSGSMFSCESCHLRSGMGAVEGTVITPRISRSWLYKPLVGAEMSPQSQGRVPARLDAPPFREAYTDTTLARAILVGKNPNGRQLSGVMPRYALSTKDMEFLLYYLKHLSAEFSPGVDESTIRFATVISHDVPAADRAAMLGVLEAHVRDHNSQSRHDEERAKRGPFFKEEKNVPYRRYSLVVWELSGTADTWRAQLDEYYGKEPVFALLGGITTGEWAPIHEFCEQNRVPSLLPITDFPVISASDWYTVYFSKGYYQEGEAAARFLRRSDAVGREVPVVQVYRATSAGRALAEGLRTARANMGLAAPTDIGLAAGQMLNVEFWNGLVEERTGAVLALWLPPADLAGVERLAKQPRPPMVFMSGTLLGDSLRSVPESARDITYVAHPYAFPEDGERSRMATRRWLDAKGLPVTNFVVQSKMYFLGWMLAGTVKMMRDDFYRDYFLERVDMMRDQYYSIAVYPRLSFGPGQRYASKGCYIAQLTAGPEPKLEKRSPWVIQ